MAKKYTKKELEQQIIGKLRRNFGREVEEATPVHMFRACALVLRDIMSARELETESRIRDSHARQVHYLSLEFLMGRSLEKNAYNLGVLPQLKEAVEGLGFSAPDLFEVEPDAGLGNGGLGRLAACYLESMTTLEIPATGYSICYELGLFKQKIVDGQQVELPDNWLDVADCWLIPKVDETERVHFGGEVRDIWGEDGSHRVAYVGGSDVLAVPKDMEIAGYGTEHVNVLRLWDAKSPTPLDMSLFSRGEYLKAVEQQAMAESIAKILYPEDNHYEGKSLRLKQQYFFVSATVQCICRQHKAEYGTLRNFHQKHVIQINDTHPSMVIPELIRLLGEKGIDFDEAVEIVTKTCAYTNHTILAEALEKWPRSYLDAVVPQLMPIIEKLDALARTRTEDEGLAIIDKDDRVHMAHMDIHFTHSTNGVAALHTEILKNSELHGFYELYPEKFNNKTNGITFRRWLLECDPALTAELEKRIGSGFRKDAAELEKLLAFAGDETVLNELTAVKKANKEALADWLLHTQNVTVNTEAVFDIQSKRLHEYKRQQLNLLYLIHQYHEIKAGHLPAVPLVSIFGAKAAPAYTIAKDIIHALLALSKVIAADPEVSKWLQVVFIENYNVTAAEKLIPACDLSEQISLASKEASGTGNMKFMLNGALTLGTMDGANVEISQQVGEENIYIFGQTSDQVIHRYAVGDYDPAQWVEGDANIRRAIGFLTGPEMLAAGHAENLTRLHDELIRKDWFQTLPDFNAYVVRKGQALSDYACDPLGWCKKCLVNIAKAGFFSSDRTIAEYDRDIWHLGQ